MQAALQKQRLAAALRECERLQTKSEGLQRAHGELQISHAALTGQLSEALAARQAAELAAKAMHAALRDWEARHAASRVVARAMQKAVACEASELRERVRSLRTPA